MLFIWTRKVDMRSSVSCHCLHAPKLSPQLQVGWSLKCNSVGWKIFRTVSGDLSGVFILEKQTYDISLNRYFDVICWSIWWHWVFEPWVFMSHMMVSSNSFKFLWSWTPDFSLLIKIHQAFFLENQFVKGVKKLHLTHFWMGAFSGLPGQTAHHREIYWTWVGLHPPKKT